MCLALLWASHQKKVVQTSKMHSVKLERLFKRRYCDQKNSIFTYRLQVAMLSFWETLTDFAKERGMRSRFLLGIDQ